MRRTVEMQQLREVWRSCNHNNVQADESCFVLNPAADLQLVKAALRSRRVRMEIEPESEAVRRSLKT